MRPKMEISERAKIFMPFAALKGYEEALRQKEHVAVPRIILDEDALVLMDRTIHETKPGDQVKAVYYQNGEYLCVTGLVSLLDFDQHVIRIVGTLIHFSELYGIEKLSR